MDPTNLYCGNALTGLERTKDFQTQYAYFKEKRYNCYRNQLKRKIILTMVSTLNNNSHIILYIINLSIINITKANKNMIPCSGKWDNVESETP